MAQNDAGTQPEAGTPNAMTPETTTAGDSVEAGDTDPGGTQSADETGQGGDPNDPAKNKAHPWNG